MGLDAEVDVVRHQHNPPLDGLALEARPLCVASGAGTCAGRLLYWYRAGGKSRQASLLSILTWQE
jgi:hypothetical protein